MQLEFQEDRNLEAYETMLRGVGAGNARRAFQWGMNQVGNKATTAVRRALIAQTSIPRNLVYAGTQLFPATIGRLEIRIEGKGRPIPLSKFGARQFSYGVRATVWGQTHQFPHTFIVARYNGGVFKRTGTSRFPIKQLWGPGIGRELVRDASLRTFQGFVPQVAEAAMARLVGVLAKG